MFFVVDAVARRSLCLACVMLAIAHTITLVGAEPHPVRVEVKSGRGTMAFDVVGLAETSVRESRHRVRAALAGIGVELHSEVITVNLAPADLRKGGSGFDLAIAAGVLGALGRIEASGLESTVFIAELSLTGRLLPIPGVLPRLVRATARGITHAIVARENAAEAAAVAAAEGSGLVVLVADDLASVAAHLAGKGALDVATNPESDPSPYACADLSEVRGQPAARHALEVAAVGGHDLLLRGPPGAGKTMIARRLPGILPPLEPEESLDITALHSIAGLLPPASGLLRVRPFRAPHHTVSEVGLLGGGNPPRPGEVSLAHGGVLFLDEFPEFRRGALEGLRQPLEDGFITHCRSRNRASFLARPMLVAAMNPCPCGYASSTTHRCKCGHATRVAYENRISGPILDRLDMHLEVFASDADALTSAIPDGESSATVRARVVEARAMHLERRRCGRTRALTNARIESRELRRLVPLAKPAADFLRNVMRRGALTARSYDKVLRIARTLGDMRGFEEIDEETMITAISYRPRIESLSNAA